MSDFKDGGPAFPVTAGQQVYSSGMSLRDWFAGQALANPAICTGIADEWQLKHWFGERTGITRAEIVANQSLECADTMLKEREGR